MSNSLEYLFISALYGSLYARFSSSQREEAVKERYRFFSFGDAMFVS